MPENLRLKAVDMDKELQEYLKQYKSKQIETAEIVNEVQDVLDNIPHAIIEVDDIIPTDNSDDLPF